jgi:branched-chain amino acid transport system permease protein
MSNFLLQTLNGVTFAGLLFLLGSGLSLTLGLMNVVNMAHGAIFLLGGYVGLSAIQAGAGFWIGILAAAAAMAGLGLVLDRMLLERLRGLPMSELLLTIGLTLVIGDLAEAQWGAAPQSITMPGVLAESSTLGGTTYPNSRLFILGLAVVVGIVLYLVLFRTRIGSFVRAGVDDRETAAALGINVKRVFTGVFMLAAALAGVAGVVGGSLVSLAPESSGTILLYSLVVVIVGGAGSLAGAALGSLVVGLTIAYGAAYAPTFSYFLLFAPIVAVLVWRPQGLLGRLHAH